MEIIPGKIKIGRSNDEENRSLYDEKYAEHFYLLARLPRRNDIHTIEENREINRNRFTEFKKMFGGYWDEFILDTLCVFGVKYEFGFDTGDVKRQRASDNSANLMECIQEVVYYYSDENNADKGGFRMMLAQCCKEKKQKNTISAHDLNKDRFAMEPDYKKRRIMGKLFKNMTDFYANFRNNDFNNKDEVAEDVAKMSKEKFLALAEIAMNDIYGKMTLSNNDLEAFYLLALNGSTTRSLDVGMDKEDDSSTTGMDMIADNKAENSFITFENREIINAVIGGIYDMLGRDSLVGIRDKEILRLFFTGDVLKELKLDSNGHPYTVEPAGNEDIYILLLPNEGMLMEKESGIFCSDYLQYVFDNNPKMLNEVYMWVMRPEIKLSNVDIQNCMGYGSRGTVSKKYDRYKELMQGIRMLVQY